MDTVRALAADILEKTLEGDGKSHLLLAECIRKHPELSGRDRRFLTQLVHGTAEKALLLDARLSEVSSVSPAKMDPGIRTILRMGMYQLLFMDRVPASAVCDESVRLAKKIRGGHFTGFVNGVLRGAARKETWKNTDYATAYSMPPALYRRFVKRFGSEGARTLCEGFGKASPLMLRVNSSRCTAEEVISLLAKDGYEAERSELVPYALLIRGKSEDAVPLERAAAVSEGLVQVQDLSSVLAGTVPAVKPGLHCLDLCAAPGGKSLHLADRLAGTGQVLACDLTDAKVSLLQENILRSHLRNIRAEKADALVFDPAKEEAFDIVLADLPCSGLGVIGRKPEIRYRVTEESIQSLAALQTAILKNAVRYLKPGGELVFSTCTLTEEENEAHIRFLAAECGLAPIPLAERLPEPFSGDAEGCAITLIPGKYGTDGFFISLFRKNEC